MAKCLVIMGKITWRYLSWRADEESLMTSEASRNARLAFCSPSAAITYRFGFVVRLIAGQ